MFEGRNCEHIKPVSKISLKFNCYGSYEKGSKEVIIKEKRRVIVK